MDDCVDEERRQQAHGSGEHFLPGLWQRRGVAIAIAVATGTSCITAASRGGAGSGSTVLISRGAGGCRRPGGRRGGRRHSRALARRHGCGGGRRAPPSCRRRRSRGGRSGGPRRRGQQRPKGPQRARRAAATPPCHIGCGQRAPRRPQRWLRGWRAPRDPRSLALRVSVWGLISPRRRDAAGGRSHHGAKGGGERVGGGAYLGAVDLAAVQGGHGGAAGGDVGKVRQRHAPRGVGAAAAVTAAAAAAATPPLVGDRRERHPDQFFDAVGQLLPQRRLGCGRVEVGQHDHPLIVGGLIANGGGAPGGEPLRARPCLLYRRQLGRNIRDAPSVTAVPGAPMPRVGRPQRWGRALRSAPAAATATVATPTIRCTQAVHPRHRRAWAYRDGPAPLPRRPLTRQLVGCGRECGSVWSPPAYPPPSWRDMPRRQWGERGRRGMATRCARGR